MAQVTALRPPRLRLVAGADPSRKVTWLELFFDLIMKNDQSVRMELAG